MDALIRRRYPNQLPTQEISRSLGDTAVRASDLGKIVVSSSINGSANNVIVLQKELIKEFKKVTP